MAEPALLNNVDHKDVRVITERSAKYGDDIMHALTFPTEFRDVQTHYPILFHRDEKGVYYPVALFGFEEGENLFLNDDGWDAHYVPAMVRRQPFLIGFQQSEIDGEKTLIRVLSIDVEHPRVGTDEGEALFQPLGGRTDYLESTANLLEAIYEGQQHSKLFVKECYERGLIEEVSFDISLDDGSRNQLLGFSTINEDRVQEMSGEALEQFNKKGFLMPLFMMLASLTNIRSLVERKNRTVDD